MSVETHHFKPFDQRAKIGIFVVVRNESWLYPLSSTFYVHAWSVNLGKVYSLEVPQAPE